ncbi:hypothetical protein ACFFYR_32085 [Paraburkholderia dipogonis]|nr:hypothetical protein [Paraburkholderia dipogonis]
MLQPILAEQRGQQVGIVDDRGAAFDDGSFETDELYGSSLTT